MKNYKKEKLKIAKAYSEKAKSYNSGKNWYEKDGENIDTFLKYLDKPSKVLSIGSGRGEVESYIARSGFEVTGVDLAPNMIDLASKEFPEVKFIAMDAENLDFESNTFDAVISRYMSQHVKLDKLILEIIRVSKDQGYIWLMLHTALDESTELEFGWEDVKAKAKMWLPSNIEAHQTLESQEELTILYRKDFPDRSKLMNDVLYILQVNKGN